MHLDGVFSNRRICWRFPIFPCSFTYSQVFCDPLCQVAGCLADVEYVRVASDTVVFVDHIGLQSVGNTVFIGKKVLHCVVVREYES